MNNPFSQFYPTYQQQYSGPGSKTSNGAVKNQGYLQEQSYGAGDRKGHQKQQMSGHLVEFEGQEPAPMAVTHHNSNTVKQQHHKQMIHKKNSLSQGLVIQRKKRMINTISTSNNNNLVGLSQNSSQHSYHLNGKQISGTTKGIHSQEVSPQQPLKQSLHLSKGQLRKTGKQYVYSSAPHSPKGGSSGGIPGSSSTQQAHSGHAATKEMHQKLQHGGTLPSATTTQFTTTTRTNSQVLRNSHNNVLQKNHNQHTQQQIQGIYGINQIQTAKMMQNGSNGTGSNAGMGSSWGGVGSQQLTSSSVRQSNYHGQNHHNSLTASSPGMQTVHNSAASPDFNREGMNAPSTSSQLPVPAFSQRESKSGSMNTGGNSLADLQAAAVSTGTLKQFPTQQQSSGVANHARKLSQTSVYLQPQLQRKHRQSHSNGTEQFHVQDGRVIPQTSTIPSHNLQQSTPQLHQSSGPVPPPQHLQPSSTIHHLPQQHQQQPSSSTTNLELSSIPHHHSASSTSVSLVQATIDRKRKSGPGGGGATSSSTLQYEEATANVVHGGLRRSVHHQRKPTIDFNLMQKGQTGGIHHVKGVSSSVQYQNNLRHSHKGFGGSGAARTADKMHVGGLSQGANSNTNISRQSLSISGQLPQNIMISNSKQSEPQLAGSRQNLRDDSRNISKNNILAANNRNNEMGHDMLMSFGDQPGQTAQNIQASGPGAHNIHLAQGTEKRRQFSNANGILGARPCTSNGGKNRSSQAVSNENSTGVLGVSSHVSEASNNHQKNLSLSHQRKGVLHERENLQGKSKNLTENSVDRVQTVGGSDKRNGLQNLQQNHQQISNHGTSSRFFTDQQNPKVQLDNGQLQGLTLGQQPSTQNLQQSESIFMNHSLKQLPSHSSTAFGKDKQCNTPNLPHGKMSAGQADRNQVQNSSQYPHQNKIIRRQIISAKSHNHSRDNSLKQSIQGNMVQATNNPVQKQKNSLHFRNQTQTLIIGNGISGQQQQLQSNLIGHNKIQQVQLAQRKVGGQPTQNRRKLVHLQQNQHSRDTSLNNTTTAANNKSVVSGARKDDSKLTAESAKGAGALQGSMLQQMQQQTPKIDEIFQSTLTAGHEANDGTDQTHAQFGQNGQLNQPNTSSVTQFNPSGSGQNTNAGGPTSSKPLPSDLLANEQSQGTSRQKSQGKDQQHGPQLKNATPGSNQPSGQKQNAGQTPQQQPALGLATNSMPAVMPSRKKISKSHNPSGRTTPQAQLKGDNPPPQKENKQSNSNSKKQPQKEGKNCIRKFAFATRVGYHPNNPNKVNQDAYILQPNIQQLPQVHLFGVCDGHGQFGRNVSSFVKVALAQELERKYGLEPLKDDPNCHKHWQQNIMQIPDPDLQNLAQVLKEAFVQVNYDIEDNTPDCKFSGTTCSIVLTRGPQLISANAGDSRAIIVDKDGNARALSRDHKPDTPDEHARIMAMGGRVRPLINQQAGGVEMGPARVWLKELEVPGLAMSRSLGDQVAQSVGVSPEPEITIYDIDANDRYIIIASDGVWEFLSNDEVAKLALPFYATGHAEQAANTIVREAAKTWKEREDVVDDITCVVVFMDVKLVEKSLKFKEASRLQHLQTNEAALNAAGLPDATGNEEGTPNPANLISRKNSMGTINAAAASAGTSNNKGQSSPIKASQQVESNTKTPQR